MHNFGVGDQVVAVGGDFNGYQGRVGEVYETGGVKVFFTNDRSKQKLDKELDWPYDPALLRPASVR